MVLLDGVDTCEFLMKEGLGSSKFTIEIIRKDTVNSGEAFDDKIYGRVNNARIVSTQALCFSFHTKKIRNYTCALSLCTDYVFEAMYQNDEARAQLDVWKTRNQDVVAVLQLKMRRHVGLPRIEAVPHQLLPAIVKSMFSHARVPGRDAIKGLIAFAKSATPQMLGLMVRFPFEVPGFFFRELASFLKLSGVWSCWYILTTASLTILPRRAAVVCSEWPCPPRFH